MCVCVCVYVWCARARARVCVCVLVHMYLCVFVGGGGVYACACEPVLLEGKDHRERVIQVMMPATERETAWPMDLMGYFRKY